MNGASQPLWKAALKPHAFQTLTRGPLTRSDAKRLECVRFIGAFAPARVGQWFMVPMHAIKRSGLSMNRGWFGVPPLGGWNDSGRLKPGLQTRTVHRPKTFAKAGSPCTGGEHS